MGNEARRVFIGLGGNLAWQGAAPEWTLRSATRALGQLGTVVAGSGLWRTEPVGPVRGQPAFVNGAVELHTRVVPTKLLAQLLDLERKYGRVRNGAPKGPRTLDLDLLLAEELDRTTGQWVATVHEAPGVTLPHPAMHTRRFVLAPLGEIAPAVVHPILHRTIQELLGATGEQSVTRLALPTLLDGA